MARERREYSEKTNTEREYKRGTCEKRKYSDSHTEVGIRHSRAAAAATAATTTGIATQWTAIASSSRSRLEKRVVVQGCEHSHKPIEPNENQ